MQGNVFIRNSSGQIEERTVTDGDGIVLNPGEEIVIAAEADTAEIHYESDTRAVIRLEGIGEFSIESNTTLPEKIALASPLALQEQQPLGIAFEESSPPAGAELKILQDTPLMHQAGADNTSYADPPSTPRVDFTAPEALRFDFRYLSMRDGESSGHVGGRQRELDNFAASNVFDYRTAGNTPEDIDLTASLPVLILSSTASGDEDSAISLDIRAELTDTDGSETLTVIISGLPEGSVLSVGTDNGDGTWSLTENDLSGLTITPPQNWDQDFDITVTAAAHESSTGETASVTGTINVFITPVNDAPVAGAVDLGQIMEDHTLIITQAQLLANSYDVDGDVLNISSVTVDPALGSITDNTDGTWTFTPSADLNGNDLPLTFTVNDGNGGTATSTATLDILPVNDAPVAGAVDLGQIMEDHTLIITQAQLLANSYDVDGDDLNITSVTVDPVLGSIANNPDGTWTFMPAQDYHGDDVALTFTVSDGNGGDATSTATLDILPVNDPPVAGAVDLGQIDEDTSLTITAAQLLANSYDVDGDVLNITSVTVDPALGSIANNPDGTWTFMPAQDYHGDDVALTFTVADGNGGTATSTATLDILPVNDPPVAGAVDLGQIDEDTSLTITAAQLLANSYDVDGDVLNITSVTVDPALGSIANNPDGTWTFMPAQDYHGDDVALTFTVADGNGGTATSTAALDILAVNDPPVAGAVDLGQIDEDTSLTITAAQLLANSYDVDEDVLNISSVTVDPALGSITNNPDGTWTFTPTADLNGVELPLTFTVNDGNGETATGMATLDVLPVNDLPVAGTVDLGQINEDTSLTITQAQLLANSYDVDGDDLSISSLNVDPSIGNITGNSDGTWTFTPKEDLNDNDILLTFTVSDGNGGTATATATLDILPVNDPPVAGAVDLGQINEDTSLTITASQLLANSYDVDGDVLNISSVTVDPALGSIANNPDGTWTFTPTADLNGNDLPLTFTFTDGNGGTATATATLDILPVNDLPVAGAVDLGQINEDTSLTITQAQLLANSYDVDGDVLNISSLTVDPALGSITNNPDGTWTFTPTADLNGVELPLTFTVNDGNGETATGMATLDILPVNDPPVAGAVDLGQINEDTSLTITQAQLLANSYDVDGDDLNITSVTVDPALGSITDNTDGTWTFTPTADLNGDDLPLTFTVTDGNGGTATSTATLDVLPVNDPPVVGAVDLGQIMEDHILIITQAQLLANSYDVDRDDLSISSLTVDPALGSITDNTDGTWTFTPTADLNGDDLPLTFTVTDGNGGTATSTATLDVLRVNDPPVVGAVDVGQINEDTSLTITQAQLLANSYDVDGDDLNITSVTVDPALGSITDNADGTWTFTPTADLNGVELPLTFTVNDGNGETATGMATLDILPVNDAPVAGAVDLGQINEDTSLTITQAQLLANSYDVDGDDLSISSLNVDPSIGNITGNSDGTWSFTPKAYLNGNDILLTFTVSDGNGGTATATATLDILPVNDPPVAGAVDLGQINEDTSLTITASQLLANSYDVDGDVLNISSVTVDPALGSIANNPDGTWTFTPSVDLNGNDLPLTFTVNDGNGGSATSTATLDVLPVNDPPVAEAVDLGQIMEDHTLIITQAQLLANSYDVDGDDLSISSLNVDPSIGNITENSDGTWTFTPKAYLNGNDILLTFTVSDGNGGTATATATLDILPVNDLPVAGAVDLGQINEDTSLTITASQLLANSYDVDGDVLNISSVTVDPALGSIANNPDGTWTFTPSVDLNGNDLPLTFTVNDGNGGTATSTATLDVLPVNDPPVAGAVDLGQIMEDHTLIITQAQLLANSYDVDGDDLSISSLNVDPSIGNITGNSDGTWTFTPKAYLNGNDILLTFTVSDGNGGTATATATLDILPVNDPPVAGAVDLGQIDEDTSLTITAAQLLANSYDVDGDDLNITSVTVDPALGSIANNSDGTWTFTPSTDLNGNDLPLTFTVNDGNGGTATATATLDVLPVNDPPVAGAVDLGQIMEDHTLIITQAQLLANSYDVDGDDLNISSVTVDPALGSITDNTDGTWTFTPKEDLNGDDILLTFTVTDGNGGTATATATLDVLPVNDLPVAGAVDLGQINEDTSLTITQAQLLANSYDVDGDNLNITSVTVDPALGSIANNPDGTWTFMPAQDYHGDDVALTFTVADGNGGTATSTAALDILAVNDPPVAGAVDLGQIDEDTSLTITQAQLLANSYDVDGDDLNITSVTVDPALGSIANNPDGTWTFTPTTDLNGNDLPLTFTVNDGNGGAATSTATLDVLPVNDLPVAGNVDLGQINEDTSLTITQAQLLANSYDVDGDDLNISSVTVDPTIGSITKNADGTWTFTPTTDLNGNDLPLTFTVNDGNGGTATATATLDILAVNDPPVAGAVDLGQIMEDHTLIITQAQLLANSNDVDGDDLSISSVTVDPALGNITNNPDGTWTFTPTTDLNANIPLTFTVSDGRGGVSTNVGLIDVLPVNDPPVAGAVDLGQINEDHTLIITKAQLLANSFDVDGDVLDISSVTVDPAIGSITDNPDGTWTFTPKANLYGDDLPITFTVTDGNGGTATATATLDVLSVEDPPVAGDVNLAIINNENTSVTFSTHVLLSNAADFDGGPLDVSGLHVHPDQGVLAQNPDGTWTFTPTEEFHGTAAITFTVTDASGDTATAQAMVDVLSVNAPPAAHDALYLGQILEDPSEPLTFTTEDLLSVVHDREGDPLSIASVDVKPYYGTVTDNGDGTWAFTPAKDFNGKVNIDYTFTDDSGGTGSGSVVIDVLPVDDLPVASTMIASAQYGSYFGTANITNFGEVHAETPTIYSEAFLGAFFYHPDGKPLTVIDVSVDPAHGTFTDNGDGTWTFTALTPAAFPVDPLGSVLTLPVPVTLTAIDDDGHTVTTTTNIRVNPYDAADLGAVAGDVYLGAILEDGSLTITWEDLMANSYDPEGDPLYLTFWVGVNPAYGIVVNNCDRIEGGHHYYNTYTFIPAENFHGDNVPLHFTVSDSRHDNDGAYVGATAIVDVISVIDVGNVDLGPILEDHSLTFTEAQLLANCEDEGDTPSIASVSVDPAQGALTHNGDGTWTFTPVENFNGDAKISFTVAYTDEQISAEANLTVIPVNDAPLAVDVDLGQSPDGALYFTAAELLANSSDIDGDALCVIAGSVTVHPHFGQILEMGPESWMYLAPEGFSYENVPISFRVSDGDLEVTATALIDVNTLSSNLPLVQTVALAPSLTVTQDTLADPDGGQLTITHVTGDAGDTLEIADQANWRHVGSDADHHLLVSTAGSAKLYVDRDVDIHVVGGVDATDGSTPLNDSLYVDDFFHTVLSGGGDDTITIDPILFHQDGIIDAADFTRIDGGDGFDVLRFGVDLALLTGTEMDLTALNAGQALNIEAIDITGNTGQDNSLTLDAASVIAVTDANNALYVQGDAGDTVSVSDAASWTHTGTSDMGGMTYNHYTGLDGFGTAADLYVQQELMTNLAHP